MSLIEGVSLNIQMPAANNEQTEDLKPEQLTRLLEAIEQDQNTTVGNMMKLALFTGLRRGEMFRLKWEHLDFERGFIHLIDPKGGQDQQVPLNEAARQVLAAQPRTKSPFVFPGRGGKQRGDVSKEADRIKTKAGLPESFRPLHGLRHVFASMLASSGSVDLYTLQKLLTHKSPKMTMRYAHLRDEALRKASELAGQMINGLASADDKNQRSNVRLMDNSKK